MEGFASDRGEHSGWPSRLGTTWPQCLERYNHTGARVMAKAEPGCVLVSSTVKDLVSGSGIDFHDHGVHQLKGVPGEWRLFTAM
jgi:hypothetical protein